MTALLTVLNGIAVGIFGCWLAASFAHVFTTHRNRWIFWCSVALLLLLQGLVFGLGDAALLRRLYPLILHLPLVVLLRMLTKRWPWSFTSVFIAYLCCQLRRWLALVIVLLLPEACRWQEAVEVVITLPLLVLLLYQVAPAIRPFAHRPIKLQCIFTILPAIYYGFDYLSAVYTNWMSSDSPVIVEFMPFVCCGAYVLFLLYHAAVDEKQSRLRRVHENLDAQLHQSVRVIHALRESQALAQQYRHDLRHHLQYVSGCIENGQTAQAQAYISGICREIEAQKVHRYCENEAANLILSSFVARAKKNGIAMAVQGSLPATLRIADSDLCVLLSNALENAIHACLPFAEAGESCTIDIQFYLRDTTLFLQVVNPCGDTVRFENGIPQSDQPEHGIGVQSICTIVKRYGGVYTFLVQDGTFILRLSL